MKKFIAIVSIMIFCTLHVQCEDIIIRAKNQIINEMVEVHEMASEGWKYSFINNTGSPIAALLRLEIKNGVYAPLLLPDNKPVTMYTLRGKDYEFNQAVYDQVFKVDTMMGAIETLSNTISVVTAPLSASVIPPLLAGLGGFLSTPAAASIPGVATLSAGLGNAAAGATAATAFSVTGPLAAIAAVISAAILGGIWGAEICATDITVLHKRGRENIKYTYYFNLPGTVPGTIRCGNLNFIFEKNLDNDLILKIQGYGIDGKPHPFAEITGNSVERQTNP